MRLSCPSCGAEAMTAARKLRLGPAGVVGCRACGAPVRASWTAVLTFLPFLVSLPFMLWVEPAWLRVASVVGGLAVVFISHLFWVPVRKG